MLYLSQLLRYSYINQKILRAKYQSHGFMSTNSGEPGVKLKSYSNMLDLYIYVFASIIFKYVQYLALLFSRYTCNCNVYYFSLSILYAFSMLSRSIFFSIYMCIQTLHISLSFFFFTVTVHKRLVFLNKSALNQKHSTVGKKKPYYNFFHAQYTIWSHCFNENDKRKPC